MKRTRRTEITIETHRVLIVRKRGERLTGYCEHCGRETTVVCISEPRDEPKLVCSRAIADGRVDIKKDNEK